MECASKEYIIDTVYRTNVLPVISECNTSCIFCSHRQNPDNIEVFKLPKLSVSDIAEMIEFLDPDNKIIIGESATRIIEGEPLLHKDIVEILYLIRKKYKKTRIQITTNGIRLSRELIDEFIKIGGIELNISINCISPSKRAKILGIKENQDICEKIMLLSGRIPFTGSAVIVPEIMEDEDIEEIASFLESCGAQVLKLYLPGYTYRSQSTLNLHWLFNNIMEVVDKLRKKYSIPIILEPSFIAELECRVEGVMKETPAFNAGIRQGDIILEINSNKVNTRVEAFNIMQRLGDPELTVLRGDQVFKVILKKNKNSSPGIIVLYDIDPNIAVNVEKVIRRHNAHDVLFITSVMAFDLFGKLLEKNHFDFKYNIVKAENRFFGGTIMCAGLLTIEDIIYSINEYLISNKAPDICVIPSIMFDQKDRDLLGRCLEEIKEITGIAALHCE